MKLTGPEVEEVLQRTVHVLRQLNKLWGFSDTIVLHPPATPEAVAELQTAVPFSLPPSYVQLLRIHDGIDNFYGIKGDFIASWYRLKFPTFEMEWKRPHMLIFIADGDFNAVAFDTNRQDAENEMEVVEISENIDADRWPSLSDFLIAYKERVEGWLAGELADRAKVSDD